jgi:hypothetical protein
LIIIEITSSLLKYNNYLNLNNQQIVIKNNFRNRNKKKPPLIGGFIRMYDVAALLKNGN